MRPGGRVSWWWPGSRCCGPARLTAGKCSSQRWLASGACGWPCTSWSAMLVGRGLPLSHLASELGPLVPSAQLPADLHAPQGVLMWVVAMPVLLVNARHGRAAGVAGRARPGGLAVRFLLRGDRRLAVAVIYPRPGQQGKADDERPLALHPPPQLLWRGDPLVGDLADTLALPGGG